MPYIPPENRPGINAAVDSLAAEIAARMAEANETAAIGTRLRAAFREIARGVVDGLAGRSGAGGPAARLGAVIVETAKAYGLEAGWTGELNYAVTMLIQKVPHELVCRGAWQERLRYWVYAETVGALTRTAYELHAAMADDAAGNGMCGVFEDIKDEYKRRVNTAYEAAQISKSGDCYGLVPFRTELVATNVNGVAGFQEIMLPMQEVEA